MERKLSKKTTEKNKKKILLTTGGQRSKSKKLYLRCLSNEEKFLKIDEINSGVMIVPMIIPYNNSEKFKYQHDTLKSIHNKRNYIREHLLHLKLKLNLMISNC